jgi:membrane protein implicated in regulation of membrane protease activity
MASLWNWLLVITGAILVLVEVALGGFAGFDLVLIGSALVLGGAFGLLLHSAGAGFAAASVLAIAYIAFGRRRLRDRLRTHAVPSNADALIGLSAKVLTPVGEHQPGQVKVRDEVWRAVPAAGSPGPYDPGAVVRVESVDGVTLRVRAET